MTTEPPHPEHGDGRRGTDSDDDLLARLQAVATQVRPTAGVNERVGDALRRRRRRRRAQVVAGSVAAAAAAVVGVVGVVALPRPSGPDAPPPAGDPPRPAIIEGGGYRPAGFFRDVVGGSALPSITRYYRTEPRIVFTARFDWSPDPAGEAYLADLSLERYRSDPEQRCSRLIGAAGSCTTRADGTVTARYEVPADGALLAPIGGEGRLRLPGSAAVVRGVTSFRTDARAVTVLVCNCSSQRGDVLSAAPPVSFEALEDVVTDASWGLRVGG